MSSKINVLWVSNYNIEVGRGPMFRLLKMMDYMSEYCNLSLFSFGPIDFSIKEKASSLGISYTSVPYEAHGWFVKNPKQIANKILEYSLDHSINLVVITWEIWDIITATCDIMEKNNIPMAVVMHSVPFAGMLEKSYCYTFDSLIRGLKEKNAGIFFYIILKYRQFYRYIKKLNIITMTPTVKLRLNKYFYKINLFYSNPGYALEITNSENIPLKYDIAFMARFEKGKGIYDLIKIIEIIKRYKKDVSLLMIGSFTFNKDAKKFKRIIKEKNLENNIVFTGWLTGVDKYKVLDSAKVFVYPSYTGDTFSISMLEALSIGKKVICYDVPFVELNYSGLKDVIKIKTHDYEAFANECLKLIITKDSCFSIENTIFVRENFGSWKEVSNSEFLCYKKILQLYN